MNQLLESKRNKLDAWRWGGFIVMGIFISMGILLKCMDKDLSLYFFSSFLGVGVLGFFVGMVSQGVYMNLPDSMATIDPREGFRMYTIIPAPTSAPAKVTKEKGRPGLFAWATFIISSLRERKALTTVDIGKAIEANASSSEQPATGDAPLVGIAPSVEVLPAPSKEVKGVGDVTSDDLLEIETEIATRKEREEEDEDILSKPVAKPQAKPEDDDVEFKLAPEGEDSGLKLTPEDGDSGLKLAPEDTNSSKGSDRGKR
jgi:hypothetical protein